MKKNKIFAFLVEPASYTQALISNIYNDLNVKYIFLNGSALIAKNESNEAYDTFENIGVLTKFKYLYRVFKSHKFIVFNGYTNWEFLFLLVLTLFSLKKPMIAIESDTPLKIGSGIKGLLKLLYLRFVFKRKYVLGFAGGNYTHKELFRHYGMSEERIFLMPMMVNNKIFYMSSKRKKGDRFSFVYVGRIIAHKNIEFLIQNFLSVFENNSQVFLRIVGNGDILELLSSRYKNRNNIIFEGVKYDKELLNVYHTSDVLVLPSLSEPWGLVVNEALCAGLPVIASNKVGAVDDLILGKDTGFVFDLTLEDDLSKKMIQIYKNKMLYTRYSENAVRLMKEHWNYDLYRINFLQAIEYSSNR
jgi:glycosyltransferase involved in cell wall biosynthesis